MVFCPKAAVLLHDAEKLAIAGTKFFELTIYVNPSIVP